MVFRLRNIAIIWLLAAMAAALTSASVWFLSSQSWYEHLAQSHEAGYRIYEDLRTGNPSTEGIALTPLNRQDSLFAENGKFDRIAGSPRPSYLTLLSLQSPNANLQIGVVSDTVQYPVADIRAQKNSFAAAQLADLTRLFALYCSEPIFYARYGTKPWQKIDGRALWGCNNAPYDLRLLAMCFLIFALGAILTFIHNTTSNFDIFAKNLKTFRTTGGTDKFEITGPAELRDIANAMNDSLAAERAQLENRAVILSSVSHDLGTPATRLRLRTALIQDQELRHKLESDIDSMTGMIESVLTYTRAEMSIEQPCRMSLTSLIEAITADYQDIGKSVTICPSEHVIVQGGRSLFMSNRGQSILSTDRQIIISGRPIALERAICNLIDNALKYGRRANVRLEADFDNATIVIEDEGGQHSADKIEKLLSPFQRGDNATYIDGHGLGLTIVQTIAALHGGSVSFSDCPTGLCAKLIITRQ